MILFTYSAGGREGATQGRDGQVLRRGHQPQDEAAQAAGRGQEEDENDRQHPDTQGHLYTHPHQTKINRDIYFMGRRRFSDSKKEIEREKDK